MASQEKDWDLENELVETGVLHYEVTGKETGTQPYEVMVKGTVAWCYEVTRKVCYSEFFLQYSLQHAIAVSAERMVSRGCFPTIRPRTLIVTLTRTNCWTNSHLN